MTMTLNIGDTLTCVWVDEEGNHCSLTYKILDVQTDPTNVLTCQVV